MSGLKIQILGIVPVLMLFLLAGCAKDPAEEAGDSDANGYLCSKCGEKFFTARDVFAEKCPKCKQLDIVEVIGFVCERDQHVTLRGRGPETISCEQCKQPVSSIKLPRAKELMAWGAIKRSKGEVLLP